MEVGLGFLAGVSATMFLSWLYIWREKRRDTNLGHKLWRVEQVLRRNNLMCGEGFPCSGGPQCDSDHK